MKNLVIKGFTGIFGANRNYDKSAFYLSRHGGADLIKALEIKGFTAYKEKVVQKLYKNQVVLRDLFQAGFPVTSAG